jgi:hypothetical protein
MDYSSLPPYPRHPESAGPERRRGTAHGEVGGIIAILFTAALAFMLVSGPIAVIAILALVLEFLANWLIPLVIAGGVVSGLSIFMRIASSYRRR